MANLPELLNPRRWLQSARRRLAGEPTTEFMDFCRQRWPARARREGPLILLHQTSWHASILGYACTANALAKRFGGHLGSFHFAGPEDPARSPLFESFGAPVVLSPALARPHAPRARELANRIFAGLRSKRDVVDITVEGLSLGDIIYDSYLRYHVKHTVDLRDEQLRETIERALLAYFASENFLAAHEVASVFVDHAVYLEAGVLSRVAVRRGAPVYHPTYNPVTLMRLDPQTFEGGRGNPARRPAGTGSCKLTLPYHLFARIFAGLPEETRRHGVAQARQQLEARLAGAFDPGVLPGGSAYQPVAAEAERVMKAGPQPRVLVMLHDYCDAPHSFRDLLFPDHYEWTCWLLERASRTPYDWYVKPHPNIAHDPQRAKLNQQVLAELRGRFPKVTFLPPAVSNLHLISEGLNAMFTAYGTSGHEFAYLGVPVVNAGDNPHINYGFNYHPRSEEEYASFVDRAGALTLPGSRDEIAEYAYMRFVHYYDRALHPVRMLPPGYEESPENFSKVASAEVLRLVSVDADRKAAELDAYLEKFFSGGRHVLPS